MEANGRLFSRMLKGKKLFMVILSLVVLSLITGFSVYATTKQTVMLSLDGEKTQVKSHAKTVGSLLEQYDVNIEKYDLLEPGLDIQIEEGMTVVWKPAKEIMLAKDGKSKTLWTTEDTVERVLAKNEINLKEHDEVTPSLDTAIKDDMTIKLESAYQVPLFVDGDEKKVWTTSTTVADFLHKEAITLGELDRVEPAKDELVTDDSEIRVIRVEKVTDVVEEAIDYATVTKKDKGLAKGQEKVVTAGKEGKVKKRYEVTLEDGKEVDRKFVKEEKVKESEDRIVAVGTKQITQTVSRKSSSSQKAPSGGKTIYMSSTAYTANCSGCSGRTATGINLKANPNTKVVAVDPNVIPLGTKVHVEGYGYAVAGDTGGAINGNKVDVFFSSKSQANSWGRKKVKVKILD